MSEETRKIKLTIDNGYGIISTIEHPEEDADIDTICLMFLAAMTGITYSPKMVLESMSDFAEKNLDLLIRK